ncbi:MAG: DUF1549 domain-containing protein [Planctomycetes bacterium]|nr:DUF1549 domain-containing protein [Planctomycetota bacterium]
MIRTTLASALSAAALLLTAATAQTAAANPQRPTRTVSSVRPLDKVLADAARLDALLERGLERRNETPFATIDDATFVRRAYLGIVGRIPTLAETERFLADDAQDKRDVLCDTLLDLPGRTSHFANYWFDLLRVKSRNGNLSGEPFAHFVRDSIQQDKPFDTFVQEMLGAEGAGHKSGNGATGMLLRDANMPHDAMANAVRLFLGTRMECAQCHNHPFDVWTQKQFYEMAAFFGGIRYREDNLPNLVGLRSELANTNERTRQQALNIIRRFNQGIDGSGTGLERLPGDYKYPDLKPGTPVLANTIFGAGVKLKYPEQKKGEPQRRDRARAQAGAPPIDSRRAFAEWMASSKNPLFTKVVANRMWARTFGRGLVEPVDDWKKDTQAVHPDLLGAIEKLMVDLDYDLRQFERVLVHTKLFQRATPPADPVEGEAWTFRGPMLRRMTAEQLWDSLLTLVFDDVDERLRAPDAQAKPVYDYFDQLSKADARELIEMVEQGRGQPMRAQQQKATEDMKAQLAADADLQKTARPLLRQLAEARRQGDQAKVAEIAAQLQRLGLPLGQRAARGREGDLLRASDLTQPAAPNHLLRQFGQSDRNTVDAASNAATVPQVLTMLNGFLDQRVLEGQSALRRDLEAAPNGERRVRIAFLTTLNREPTEAEVTDWRKAIAIQGDSVVKDLVWVLCNSNEFRFVQ